MRKIVSWLLIGLGAFLLMTAILFKFWAPGETKKTPLDINTKTYLAGTAQKINPETGNLDDLDVKIVSNTKVDSKDSTDDVALFVNTTCVTEDVAGAPECVGDKEDPRLINNSIDVFATDRVTARAVNDEKFQKRGATPHEGLVNKFPFDTEKKSYPYWDGLLEKAVDLKFEGTEKIDGLETYVFREVVDNETAEVAAGTEGTYSQDKTIWVEPKTGSIVKQAQEETRAIDGDTVFHLEAQFTDQQVRSGVEDAKKNVNSLNLLNSTAPLIGFIAGPLLILVGLFLLLTGRRKTADEA